MKEIAMTNEAAFPATTIREWIRTEFSLPVTLVNKLTSYQLRVWEAEYVFSLLDEGTITVALDNTGPQQFIVHWASLPSVCRSAAKIALSFRVYDGVNYVVLKVWKQGE
jgi:hypothetical protein